MSESVPQIYVVDDDLSVREALGSLIRSAGLSVRTFALAQEMLASLRNELPNCLVLDIQLPDINGFELQQELATKDIQIPIIFLTGHGDIPMSVRAIKAGAVEFLTKPFDDEYLLEAIRSAIARDNKNERSPGRIAKEYFEECTGTDGASRAVPNKPEIVISSHLNGSGKAPVAFAEIIGQGGAWRQIIRQIEMVAPTDATVLVLGETGTGKELIARELHRRSRRKGKPLVRVNCACIPKDLYESEFFGHARGAFTSAVKDRIGRFEAAAGGTLFLDEIGEIPLELQSKLLRVLQEKCYERVGEERTRHADVRIVAATNRDLKKEVAAGRFREDLYYRLNDGLQVITELMAFTRPKPRIVVVTTYETEEDIRLALQAGAKGYLVKGALPEQILETVRRVAEGKSLLPATVAAKLAKSLAHPKLTAREFQVLRHIATGSSDKEIGQKLKIALPTVRTHVQSILAKLDAMGRTEAIAIAKKRGLLRRS